MKYPIRPNTVLKKYNIIIPKLEIDYCWYSLYHENQKNDVYGRYIVYDEIGYKRKSYIGEFYESYLFEEKLVINEAHGEENVFKLTERKYFHNVDRLYIIITTDDHKEYCKWKLMV